MISVTWFVGEEACDTAWESDAESVLEEVIDGLEFFFGAYRSRITGNRADLFQKPVHQKLGGLTRRGEGRISSW